MCNDGEHVVCGWKVYCCASTSKDNIHDRTLSLKVVWGHVKEKKQPRICKAFCCFLGHRVCIHHHDSGAAIVTRLVRLKIFLVHEHDCCPVGSLKAL